MTVDWGSGPALAGRITALAALIWAFLVAYRWIARRERLLAVLFAAGVTIRALSGLTLFVISWYQLPIFRSLQLGGGFWTLALDGRTYYDLAANAVAHGLATVSDSFPSPLYIRTLAVWMWVFGANLPSALLLNVACYAVSIVGIVATGHLQRTKGAARPMALAIAVAAVTFSPALLIFGTQPLKDPLCLMLMILAIAGAALWWNRPGASHRMSRAVVAATIMAVAIYGVSGIRAYVAVFTIAAVALAGAYSVMARATAGARWRTAFQHSALLALLWMTFIAGAGPYAEPYQLFVLSTVRAPSTGVGLLDTARAGFVATGGGTSLEFVTFGQRPHSLVERVGQLARGYVAFLVPISILQAASMVKLAGGARLLLITDLDTIVIDLTVVASLFLLVVSARRYGLSPAPVFAIVLGLLLTTSMVYVVTNYGTLFRLRLLAVAPFWMLPAVIPQSASGGKNDSAA